MRTTQATVGSVLALTFALALPATAGGNEIVVLSVPPPGSQTSMPSSEVVGYVIGDPGPQTVFEVMVRTHYGNGQYDPPMNSASAYDESVVGWAYPVTNWDPVNGLGTFKGRAKWFDEGANDIHIYLPGDPLGSPAYSQQIVFQPASVDPSDVVAGIHPVQRSVDLVDVNGDPGKLEFRMDLINTTANQTYTVDVIARCELPGGTMVNLPVGGPGEDTATYTIAPGDFSYTSVQDPVSMSFSFPLDEVPFPQPAGAGEYRICVEVYDGPALIYFEEFVSYWVSDRAGKAFRDVTANSGLDAVHLQGGHRPSPGNSIAVFDYNNDALPDLYFTNPSGSETFLPIGDNWPFPGGRNFLMENNGDGTFADVTVAANAVGDNTVSSYGVAWADLDDDGFNDLLVANRSHQNYLFHNNGDSTFTDIAQTSFGGPTNRWHLAPRFGDYDRDGDLDLYMGCYMQVFDTTWENIGFANILYRNEFIEGVFDPLVPGFPVFTQVPGTGTESKGDTLGAMFMDANRDQITDLFVHHDFGPMATANEMFRGTATGDFVPLGPAAGYSVREFSMGAAAADFDGDLFPDIYSSSMGRNSLLLSNGDGTVTQSIVGSGAEGDFITEGPAANGVNIDDSWGVVAWDYDLDGDTDIYNVGAYIFTTFNIPVPELNPDAVYRNDGFASFTKTSEALGLANAAAGRGAVSIDLDGDGDLDIVTSNENEGVTAMRNDFVTPFNYIAVRPQATRSAPGGFNTFFEIVGTSSGLQARELGADASAASQMDNCLTFGLRNDATCRVRAYWPRGGQTSYYNVPANGEHQIWETVVEVNGEIQAIVPALTAPAMTLRGEPGEVVIVWVGDPSVPVGLPLPGGAITDIFPLLPTLYLTTLDVNGEAPYGVGTMSASLQGLTADLQMLTYNISSGLVEAVSGVSSFFIGAP